MKYELTDSFIADFKKLKAEHRATFKKVVREKFAPACDSWAKAQRERTSYVWPKSLRVDEMRGAPGVMEMTWSFASPDGRATFHLVLDRGEWVCRWRRIGDHGVYDAP
jgi:hypothetical protein